MKLLQREYWYLCSSCTALFEIHPTASQPENNTESGFVAQT